MTDPKTRAIVSRVLAQEAIPATAVEALAPVCRQIADRVMARAGHGNEPLFIGLCGAQGSGKSTMALVLEALLAHAGLPTAQLSLDDLYLTAAARHRLAETLHPLLRTRGVPGTHDLPLGLALLAALRQASAHGTTAIPGFDKASDDRLPESRWRRFHGRPAVILLEGWCVGALPQPVAALAEPLNPLERDEDPDGTWRWLVNDRLGGEYQVLFGQLDLLILLRAPGFETVFAWRKQQEDKLRARLLAEGRSERDAGVMDDATLVRFINHYERLTRHILAEMPARADMVVTLGADRAILGVDWAPDLGEP